MAAKNILVISYSQSGQLVTLTERFIRPLLRKNINVEHIKIMPLTDFSFPWHFWDFFNIFPETVHSKPCEIAPLRLQNDHYDLVVIAYTVWFLSPSQPITAFLQTDQARSILNGKPVVTLIACRNMWLMAQEKIKKMLKLSGARLIGNIVKTDECSSAASFIATPLWMFTGRKQFHPWLPKAGVSESDIADMERFGLKLGDRLTDETDLDESLFRNMGAVTINEKLIASEKVGQRSFYVWGKLIMAAGHVAPVLRHLLLAVYIVFLVVIILTVVPVTAILKTLLSPLQKEKIRREKAYYAAPSGE